MRGADVHETLSLFSNRNVYGFINIVLTVGIPDGGVGDFPVGAVELPAAFLPGTAVGVRSAVLASAAYTQKRNLFKIVLNQNKRNCVITIQIPVSIPTVFEL